jgi:hypothetical protein
MRDCPMRVTICNSFTESSSLDNKTTNLNRVGSANTRMEGTMSLINRKFHQRTQSQPVWHVIIINPLTFIELELSSNQDTLI